MSEELIERLKQRIKIRREMNGGRIDANTKDMQESIAAIEAITAERDALAAELKALREQSPAGKLHSDSIDGHVFIPTGGDWSCLGMSLYAHPVPARELTDEEILNALDGKVGTQFLTTPVTCKEFWLTAGSVDVREFVRAIECYLKGEEE